MEKAVFIREKLKRGEAVIGTWSNIPSPVVTDIIASSGLDFIIIDCEHGPLHFETAMQMMVACEANRVSPCLRIGAIQAVEMQKALDIGAHCVHIPNISTAQEAQKCVEIFKYPPLGARGFSPFTRAGGYGGMLPKAVVEYGNREPLLAIHIEDARGIENIHEILQVAGIDIIFLGLFDLSKSLGIPGEITHPKLLDLLKQLTHTIRSQGKYPGTIVMNSEQLERSLDFGIQYIAYSVDCYVLRNGYKEVIQLWNSGYKTKERSSLAGLRESGKRLL